MGLDCSGLVQELLTAVGMDIPGDQNAQAFYDHFSKPENGTMHVIGLGSLIFYGKSIKEISHIVMVLDDMYCIGANGGGSKTVNAEAAAMQDAFVKVRPIHYRQDLVAVVMPKYP
jgi:cell wall-associated NlpC family hydrolase